MASLTLGGTAAEPPSTYAELLDRLAASPRPAAVWYDGSSGDRVELSGRVLANWAVKLINLISSEWEISPEAEVVIDMPPHWKTAAVHLAVRALGPLKVRTEGSGNPEQLVIAADPLLWAEDEDAEFEELAGVSLGLLDSSFEDAAGEALPAWALDVSAEVRQHPDQLVAALPPTACPEPAPGRPPLLVTAWDDAAAEAMISSLVGGGVVVLYQGEPEGETWSQMLRQEGVE
ncbi:TIGR03089 family protein [Nesterenkonia populi]|uniref:TIGR03089 family protein n=1 Tax=Nesterenkonia populi TaxID=1591087 RepID=UPI0011BF2836|nr:TIGR03089 family protein [Nesterenkonia populi]